MPTSPALRPATVNSRRDFLKRSSLIAGTALLGGPDNGNYPTALPGITKFV